jgi:hemolysin activation/secretion protein
MEWVEKSMYKKRESPMSKIGVISQSLIWVAITLMPVVISAEEIISPGVERSLIGSPASPEFGMPDIPTREEILPVQPVLPPAEPAEDNGILSSTNTLFVSEIRIEGVRQEDREQLRAITQPYERRTVSISELLYLRHQISHYYLQKGYINSGAVIPDQNVADGIVEIKIIEGKLTQINPQGQSYLSDEFIRTRIARGVTPPLDIKVLGENLQILQQHPVINSLKSELRPGINPGEAILDVVVNESRPYDLSFGVANSHSPSVGEFTANGEFVHHSLTRHSDRLRIVAAWSEGLRNAEIAYAIPVNKHDTKLELYYKTDSTVVVEAPFQNLDITGRNRSARLTVTHPLVKTTRETLSVSLGLEVRESKTKLLGVPFDFSQGSVNGRSKTSILAFSQEWLKRQADQVLAVRSTFRYGMDAFNPTEHDDLPDNQFLSWLGQLQMAKRVNDKGHQVITRAELQLANDSLLTMEKYALGGMDSVRGYRTNQLVRDNAFLLSIEYRLPVRLEETGKGQDQLILFADYGQGWNKEDESRDRESISGIGLGYLWRPNKNFQAELFWGQSLNNKDTPGDSIQDRGIYFNLTANPF